MIFYFIVFLLLASLSLLEIFTNIQPRLKSLLELFSLFFSIFLSSIRCGAAGDYYSYKEVFEQTPRIANVFLAITTRNSHATEIGYNLLNYLVKIVVNNYQIFVFVEALIVNLLLFYLLKTIFKGTSKSYVLTAYLILWSLGLYNIVIVRQTIAVMVCWCSIKYIQRKEFVKFLILFLIAFSIHRACIIWIFAYFIYHIKTIKIRYRVIYYVILFIMPFVMLPVIKFGSAYLPGVIGEKISYYLSQGLISYGESYGVVFLLLKSIINVMFILFIFTYLYERFDEDNLYIGLYNLVAFGTAIVVMASISSNELSRLATPYTMLSVFLFKYLFELNNDNKNKLFMFGFLIAYMALRLFVYINGSSLSNGFENIL